MTQVGSVHRQGAPAWGFDAAARARRAWRAWRGGRAVLAGVAGLAGLAGCVLAVYAEPHRGSRMDGTLSYTTTLADDRHSTELEVGPDGLARLRVGSNRDARGRPVGLFRLALPPELHAALREAAHAPALAAMPPAAPLGPDVAYREIRIGGGAAPSSHLVGEGGPPPAAFARAEAAFLAAIEAAWRAPEAALGVELAIAEGRWRVGDSLRVQVRLHNPGRVALTLPGPQRWGLEDTAASLVALRADKSLAELQLADQVFVTLDAATWRPEAARADPPLRLEPGDLQAWNFELPLRWEPGLYRLELALELTTRDAEGRVLFSAALLSAPQVLRVLAR